MTWIPGNSNLTNPGTKPNCQLTDTLQLLLVSEKLPIDFNEAVIQSSDHLLGNYIFQKGRIVNHCNY